MTGELDRSPDDSSHEGKFQESFTTITEVLTQLDQSTTIFLIDGFNLSTSRGPESNKTLGMTHKEWNQAESLLNLTKMLFMELIMLSPARHKSIMDLYFKDNDEIIHDILIP